MKEIEEKLTKFGFKKQSYCYYDNFYMFEDWRLEFDNSQEFFVVIDDVDTSIYYKFFSLEEAIEKCIFAEKVTLDGDTEYICTRYYDKDTSTVRYELEKWTKTNLSEELANEYWHGKK